jgi:hypothetical protein
MNTLFYYILVSFLPLISNFFAYIICLWSAYELEDIKHYLDTSIRIVFIFILGYVLAPSNFYSLFILIIFILFAMSNYFWKFEKVNIFIFAMLIVLMPDIIILIAISIYFIIATTLAYNKFHQNKTVRFSMYPLHAVHFMKKYWHYYLFILLTLVIVLIITFLV